MGKDIIVGVDRLNFMKGPQERFSAYELLLTSRPELHEEMVMLQIAPPSRGDVLSYQQIRADLNSLLGRINGKFASFDWVSISYSAHTALHGSG